ncbi:MAG: PAS domain S-box protein [Phycisphaerae bacterium]|nr:PAS domain S-box protein [Phycisphaerae bacterium]
MAIVVVVGVVLSVIAYTVTWTWETRRASQTVEVAAESLLRNLEAQIAARFETLRFVRRLYESSELVDRAEFDAFVGDALAARLGCRMVAWAPRVVKQGRTAMEEAVRAEGFHAFSIVPAGDRKEYFPLDFLVPHRANMQAHGYDIASDDGMRGVLDRARDADEVAVSIPRPLTPVDQAPLGVYAILPVYHNNCPRGTVEERREHLAGYVVSVSRVPDLAGAIGHQGAEHRLHVVIEDVTDACAPIVLYACAGAVSGYDSGVHLKRSSGDWDCSFNVPVGGRLWSLRCSAGPAFEGVPARWPSYSALLGGLLLTAALGMYLLSVRRRAAHVARMVEQRTADLAEACERLRVENAKRKEAEGGRKRAYEELEARVERRTHDLADTNERLKTEITERARTEARLREVSARDNALLAALPDIVIGIDTTEVCVWTNQAGLEFFGDTIVGKSVAACCIGDEAFAAHVHALSNGDDETLPFESWHPRRDGEARHLAWRRRAFKDGRGRVVGGVLVGRDVTDQKRAEAAVRDSEARYRAITQAAQDAIITTDGSGTIRFWNAAAERIFGLSSEEALGQNIMTNIVPTRFHETKRASLALFQKTGEGSVIGKTIELSARHKDGTEFPVELSLSSYREGDSHVAVAFVHDITERKRVEGELLRLRVAVDDAADAILIVEADGAVTYMNFAFFDLFDCTLEMLHERGWESVWTDPAGAARVLAAARGGDLFSEEAELVSTTGRRFWAEVRGGPILNDSGPSGGMLLIVSDVSERKEAEAERLQYVEVERERNHLQDAVRALERVLGVVGHELRTPLAGMRAMTEFLLKEESRDEAEFKTFLEGIQAEVVKMAGIVNNTLEVARLNSGLAQWNWSEVHVADACRQAMDTVRPLVDHDAIDLVLNLESDDMIIRGDSDAIRRLLVNLLSNAQKNTHTGFIGLDAAMVEVDGEVFVEIAVRDTGQGMATDVASRLGVAFALNSGVVGGSHVNGSGLGLAICSGIVAAHGGTISASTERAKGTTVRVRLRADLPQPADVNDVGKIECEVRS